MTIDITKIALYGQQFMALANLGAAIVQAGAGVVAQVTAILKAHGYEHDTSALDELIADAERRRQIAIAESQTTQ